MGVPGSGKSSYARSLQRQCEGLRPQVALHVVSVDELYDVERAQEKAASQSSPVSSFSPAAWHQSRAVALQTVTVLVERLTGASVAPPARMLVLIDDVFHLRSMRAPYFRLCRERQIPFAQLFIDEPLSICLARHAFRTGTSTLSSAHSSLTSHVITNLHASIQRPAGLEAQCTLSSPSCSLPSLPSLLSILPTLACVPALPPSPSSSLSPLQSHLHVLDLCMRRLISHYIATHGPSHAHHLNALRRAVLRDVKLPGTPTRLMLDEHREAADRKDGVDVRALMREEVDEAVVERVAGVLDYFRRMMLQAG